MTVSVMIGICTIILLFVMIMAGVHISIALALSSFLGVLLISGGKVNVALSILSATAYSGIREYSFIVLPLFLMMGIFMSHSGSATALFTSSNYLLRRVPGGLGVATVASNALFAAVTGVSVASAAVFSKVAMPEMVRYKYDKSFAVGTVSGSSVLGMLIPPSALMIIYGMQAEVSIGKLFLAGVGPGIVLATIYSIYIIVRASMRPKLIGREVGPDGKAVKVDWSKERKESLKKVILGPLPTILLIILVMGGIWGGFFTPYEAAAFGCLGSMIIALCTGMRWKGLKGVVLETASSGASIMLLLIAATMYSRMLSMSGLVNFVGNSIIGLGLPTYGLIALFCVILLLLGCVLDSTSILLLTVPLMAPVMRMLGMDLVWFGIVMIVTIEMGLLTPPFGMVVFAVDAAVDKSVGLTVNNIFRGSVPYLFLMALLVIMMIAVPSLVTWLPNLG
ncbi:MAG: TRAP transporter large permease [Ruminococcaceae bacterium]|nr:TRAP transporter large permease [Oscillospiraceae bacterium]